LTLESDNVYRAMKGSLSNRGCYLNASGIFLENLKSFEEVSHFICFDCGFKFAKKEEHMILDKPESRKGKILRPLCLDCFIARGKVPDL